MSRLDESAPLDDGKLNGVREGERLAHSVLNPSVLNPSVLNPGVLNPGVLNPGMANRRAADRWVYGHWVYGRRVYGRCVYCGWAFVRRVHCHRAARASSITLITSAISTSLTAKLGKNRSTFP